MTRPTYDLAVAFRDHWNRHFALPEGSRLVIGVSGGSDSMALLALLGRDRLGGDLQLIAAQFDHGVRGEEGAADGRFVAAVAEQWGVRSVCGSGDAGARAEEDGRGLQAAARRLRYKFFQGVVEESRAVAVATAHHRDDRVETVLWRIVRGTSLDGLAALPPIDDWSGLVRFRPLLPFNRSAIDRWVEETGIPFREDPSNALPRYARTRVRGEVVPLLKELNPRADEAVVRLSALAGADAAYLQEQTARALAQATVEKADGVWRLTAAAMVDLPEALLSRVLLAGWAWSARAEASPPGAEWVSGAIEFIRGGHGGHVESPGGAVIRRWGQWIEFARATEAEPGSGASRPEGGESKT